MAKTKKPKKKYVPRTVYFPKIINTMLAFSPLQDALDNLVDKGEILADCCGKYVYRNSVNEEESFEAGLEIYSRVVELICEKNNLKYNLEPIKALHAEMVAQEGFEEETILNAKECLEFCRLIIAAAPTLLVRELTLQVGRERMDKNEQPVSA